MWHFQSGVVHRPAPKSSAERSREFRKRNPGYYQRLHAKRRAGIEAERARRRAEREREAAALMKAWREAVMPPLSVPITHLLPPAQGDESATSLREFIAIPSVEELASWERETVGVAERRAERPPRPSVFRR
jgi:hypothetical protein